MSCPDKSGLELVVDGDVLIVGKVKEITHPPGADYCSVKVEYQQGSSTVTKIFRSKELIKGVKETDEEDGSVKITGVVSGPGN